ncbi:hypothetical protein Tco_1303715 [Tanacetum coccineum]
MLFRGHFPGQMTHLVASLTLDSARSCVMQGAFLTQGKASSIPIVFSWGDSISPDGFLPFILLLFVIIVAVAIVVTVILVVVVSEGWANEFHQDKASSVRVPVVNFTLQSSVQLLQGNTDSVRLNQQMRPTTPFIPLKLKVSNSAKIDSSKGYSGGGVVDLTGDEDPTDEDGDDGMGDPIGGYVSLDGVGTDISKITRKPSKTGKHGHEERKSTKEARDAKPKAGKVKKSKLWSTLGQFSVNKSQP